MFQGNEALTNKFRVIVAVATLKNRFAVAREECGSRAVELFLVVGLPPIGLTAL